MFATTNNAQIYRWGVIFIAFLFCFCFLGKKGVFPWDEARYGENAYWMNEKGDFVNYYFANQIDHWNAKPPLGNWLIALNYRWLGYNTWALRLHSALAGVLFFAIFYAWLIRYRSPAFAAIACLILMSVKGVVGHHVSRTGDTDALLLLWLMGFVYAFSVWVERGDKKMIWLASICLGLSFYSKGTAMLFFLPGTFIYLLIQKKLRPLLGEWHFWAALFLLGSIIGSWFALVQIYGLPYENPDFPGTNRWETLLLYDTIQRFTETGIEGAAAQGSQWGYILQALDIKFNLWNYAFYLSLIVAIGKFWPERSRFTSWIKQADYKLYLICLCVGGSFAGLLTVSQSKLVWYISPILPFVAVGATALVFHSYRRLPALAWLWGALLLFSIGRQARELYQVSDTPSQFIHEQRTLLKGADRIYLYRAGTQEMQLYADWYAQQVLALDNLEAWQNEGLIIGSFSPAELSLLQQKTAFTPRCKDGYCIIR